MRWPFHEWRKRRRHDRRLYSYIHSSNAISQAYHRDARTLRVRRARNRFIALLIGFVIGTIILFPVWVVIFTGG